jgi:hypothetical protein
MAEGSISRRRALKLFAGTAIAALIPSRALADDDECVRVCHVPFNRDTEECDFASAQTRCVSRRERRRHLENHPCDCQGRCANCLTRCLPDRGTCTSNGQCCSGNCSNGFCCPVGRVGLSNSTCVLIGGVPPAPCNCPANPPGCGCFAERDPAGSRQICGSGGTATPCNAHIDCTIGQFCGQGGCIVAC